MIRSTLLALLLAGAPAAALAQSTEGPPPLPAADDGPPPLPDAGPPPLPALKYWAGIGGEKVGPLDREALAERVAAGELTHDTLVWEKGMGDWEAASTRENLAPLLGGGGETAAARTASAQPEPEEEAATPGFDAATFLDGSWSVSGTMPIEGLGQGRVTGTETFGPGNAYAADAVITIDELPAELSGSGLTAPLIFDAKMSGTYEVSGQTGNRITLRVKGDMSMSDRGGMGLNQSEEMSESATYERLDADRFKDTETGMIATRK